MKQINVGIIGPGWCGGIRAETCAASALINELHLAEIRPDRLAEISEITNPTTTTDNYHELLGNPDIDAIYICATPEGLHYSMARDSLLAGKHVFMEKPIAVTLGECDELTNIAKKAKLKFSIGYSQRFNHKYAYVKKALKEGAIGKPVSAVVSRHLSRALGDKISGRVKLSLAAMEATHDLDFVFWCLEPAKPIRVFSQVAYGAMKEKTGAGDTQWIMVTMDNGVVVTIGAGWTMPPGYHNYSSTWVEFVATDGMMVVDDTHRDVMINTMKDGIQLPMSAMPGERVDHVFAGPMHNETLHFAEAVAFDRDVMVTPEQARKVMEVYMAADLSSARNEPVTLPMNDREIETAAPV